jgi:hypothetical protein
MSTVTYKEQSPHPEAQILTKMSLGKKGLMHVLVIITKRRCQLIRGNNKALYEREEG